MRKEVLFFMKKLFAVVLSFILLCFVIPIIFTTKWKSKEIVNIEENEETKNTYDYKNYAKIKLLHTENKEVEEIPLDEYLYGVVASEMPANFELEALKAQSVVARTYTIYVATNNKKHENADICDDFACCQAWISKEERLSKWNENERESNWNKIVESVNSTQGKLITYEGKVIEAFFHANSGGKTETAINVWGGSNYPYLSSVETSR